MKYFLQSDSEPGSNGMDDICLVHQALSCLNWQQVDTAVNFCGKRLSMPVMINAITGGADSLAVINRQLARAAAETGVAMAVGSQKIALDDYAADESFRVTRQENPDGVILANVNALTPVADVQRAVEMLDADGVQLHLNPAQELSMAEGDRDFSRSAANIAAAVRELSVPVIVKEVGFGISRETAVALGEVGVRWVDVGGRGGTDFLKIEGLRFPEGMAQTFSGWGLPTAVSMLETKASGYPFNLVASGGIITGLEVAKAVALGADMAGMAGVPLRILLNESYGKLIEYLQRLQTELITAMMLTGADNIGKLSRVPMVITGDTREWCLSRGISMS
ncbi:type 2 isopentenyl-diphosphate Delta-isomerase [Metallumcola ferriviriculae]|uniref:Isopentenyl-diphosphate delta-isomerase n=1 Tax=Metallumcola ferriviriculae TaxID=3039180 RepID=A0AAU0URU3_9FIRM|nr:type 2 isopentenyl-diphosphate Delta-isomerase [Desulfitibacteraceae bacterium MK1]